MQRRALGGEGEGVYSAEGVRLRASTRTTRAPEKHRFAPIIPVGLYQTPDETRRRGLEIG